jgi:hypothetical protein
MIEPRSTYENIIDDYFGMLSELFMPWLNHRPFKPSTITGRDFFKLNYCSRIILWSV